MLSTSSELSNEKISDQALAFLTERYKHNNFKFVKLIDIPHLPKMVPWLCVVNDQAKNKQRLVTIQDNEWQTITLSVLNGIQQQLAQTLKDIKAILKQG